VKCRVIVCLLLAFGWTLTAAAQELASSNSDTSEGHIGRTTKAVGYVNGQSTRVDIKGTSLMPALTGEAKVISKRGLTDVHVEVQNLRPPSTLDRAYVTFVLWSISPQGDAKNVGELVERNGKASLHTTTALQAFALIISAEPDFAVSAPSEFVVAENLVRSDTKGSVEPVDVRYDVLPRSAYVSQVTPVQNSIYGEDRKAPLDLVQARNAVRIATDARSEHYAPEIFRKSEALLGQAEDYYRRKQSEKAISTVARQAVQTAEEARVISVKAEQQAEAERERRETEERAQQAQSQAEQAQHEAQRAKEQAEAAEQQRQQAAQQAEQEAERRRQTEEQQQVTAQQAQQAQQQAEQEAERRRQLEQQQQSVSQQAQLAQQQAEEAQRRAQAEADQRAAAEQQSQQSQAQAAEARRQADEAQQRAQQAEANQAQLRERLMSQLNAVLETRDSARGLIVSMPDVLFDTGSANLKSTARERLAKVAGILIAYPDIRIEVDGYTDSTGSPLFNEQLSQQRADSVRSYLNQQGVQPSLITTRGFGQNNPVASNDTPQGRQQNRRVEMVVSGQSIGTGGALP
jgi:outer membrane protein OmpA-like peptidoglycan-associated protein